MDYYEKKKELYLKIDQLTSENRKINITTIVYFAATNYGFSRKIVLERLKLLENIGKITINEEKDWVKQTELAQKEAKENAAKFR